MQGNNINLNNLTFTPQTITETETADILFTESHNTAFVVGKTVQGILKIEANNEQSITKVISMTAAGVYDAGVNDAKANHITWTPITPASYSTIIATHGNVQTYGNSNNKYIQVQFSLTADHLNSNNESTYPYTIPNDYITTPATFNVDVTDLVNSGGTISVSRLDITNATGYDASSTSTDITGSDSTSGKSNYTVTATGTVRVNNESSYSNVALDITGITKDIYLERYSVSVRSYNSTTHRLYLRSNYEVRLDNGNGAYERILDVYDKGDDNSVDISNYISGGSGIDINDVRLYLTQASNVSDDYDTGISMTSGSLTYDPDNDRLIGYANAFLDTGANTEQDSRRVKIIMSASKKPGSGGTTINTTGVIRVLSGSTYKEAYQSGNSWYIDVKPTVNGTEYTTVPLDVTDVYTKGYNANQGTIGAWSYTIEDKDTVYEEDPLTISFGSEVNYYNGYLYGNVNIKHGTYNQRFAVSMSTEDVPTGGDEETEPHEITANGTYRQPSGVRWEPITVNVKSGGGYTIGSASSTFTENGQFFAYNDGLDGWSVINIDVPTGSTSNYGYHRLSFSRYYEPGTGWKWSYSLYIYDTDNNYLASESGDVTQTN